MYEPAIDHRRRTDRRVKVVAFRFPDRRRGFARRQADQSRFRAAYGSMIAAYRSKPQLVAVVLACILTLNVADLLLTVRALELGAAELNPIMAILIDSNLMVASIFKMTIGFGVVVAMWPLRRYRLILEASLVLLVGFALLTGYSVISLLAAG